MIRERRKVSWAIEREAALREFQQNPEAFAVVTDLSMPAMSGLQFARELRKMRSDIPIVLTSGYFDPENQRQAAKLGVRAILAKPVGAKELLGALPDILQNRRPLKKSQSAG